MGIPGEMRALADKATEDMLRNFWRGDAKTGHMMKEDHGYETEGDQQMIWAHAMMLIGMDAMAAVTGEQEMSDRIAAQWAFTKETFSEEELVRPGMWPNIAVDDAGWDAMAYMIWYRTTGDPFALKVAGEVIRNSYEYWKDGDIGNGLWYPQVPPSQGGDAASRTKSLYSAALILAAMEYCEETGDDDLFEETMRLYRWKETHLLRDGRKEYPGFTLDCDDKLYFIGYNENRETEKPEEAIGPQGGTTPMSIHEAGSCGFLGGIMGMGTIHARLYRRTGDRRYLERALETVYAVTDGIYNQNGVLINDRDAWTNGAFARGWAEEVLTLPGVRDKDKELLFNTARSIAENARTPKGYYGGSWSGPAEGEGSAWYRAKSIPEQIMTSATSTNMIIAAALLETLQ